MPPVFYDVYASLLKPYEAKIQAIETAFKIPTFVTSSIRTKLKQLLWRTVLVQERTLKDVLHQTGGEKRTQIICNEFISTADKLIKTLQNAAPEITISHKKTLFAARVVSLRKEIESIDEVFEQSTTVISYMNTLLTKLTAIELEGNKSLKKKTGTAIEKHFKNVTNKLNALGTEILKPNHPPTHQLSRKLP